MWDVFISHASEDKVAIGEPLAVALREYCLRVWLDRWELRLGDSLRRKIDEGISGSRAGIVVLSHAFFSKRWPQDELDALLNAEQLIPVWHGLDMAQVRKYSPLIAAKLAATTDAGIPQLAGQVAQALGCSSKQLALRVDTTKFDGPGCTLDPNGNKLAQALQDSEDVPGEYTKRRVTADFVGPVIPYSTEIACGLRLLVTLEPLTYPVRTRDLLSTCMEAYVKLYSTHGINLGDRTKIDVWRDDSSRWISGIWIPIEDERRIAAMVGIERLSQLRGNIDRADSIPSDILASAVIPKLLFDFFRKAKTDRVDYVGQADQILSLGNWVFGPG
jgi:TIR domain